MDKMNYFTISEAAEKWHIKKETIMRYISEGAIANLLAENNIIKLPDIPPPHYMGKRKNIDPYREILKAIKNAEYIDSYLFADADENTFITYMKCLLDENYIKAKITDPDLTNNIDFVITPKGIEAIEKRKLNIPLAANVNLNVNVNNNQIGLINGKLI